jgi:uncharacterized repeat protein (TIGR03803 family)
VLLLAVLAHAQTFTTLYNFTGSPDGYRPFAGVIQDPGGNVYGTTFYGGDLNCYQWGCGVVFKLDTGDTETVLHAFSYSDGVLPEAPLVRDSSGNLYGTTSVGGSDCADGCGTVFKIDTAGTFTVLHTFNGGTSDGCWPSQGLAVDSAGALFGTTFGCGSSGNGTVFKVDSAGKFTILYSFGGSPSDGAGPVFGHLTMDKSGSLYGVTVYGGRGSCYINYNYGCGAVFKVDKNGKETVLHSFNGGTSDGCWPYGSVVQDKAGNLYGTTYQCGSGGGYGTAWKVSKNGKETILHNFAGHPCCYPQGGVARDPKGNLYGVTTWCGGNNWGVLYKLSPSGRRTVLHRFDGPHNDFPLGEVLLTANGTLFGTTEPGGAYDAGTVWEYVP